VADTASDPAPTAVSDWVPRPDPTALTSAAVRAATEQWRRDLEAQWELTTREIEARCGELAARLDASDAAAQLRLEALREVRPQTERQIQHLRELHGEKFAGIAQQFAERDIRTDQAAKAAKEALDAALLAAKELVGQQNTANAAAAAKAEASFAKQIEQIDLRIRTLQEGFDARLGEMKERIDRGEGGSAGAAKVVTERRLDAGLLLAIVVAALAVVSAVVTIVVATRG
jgi:hypothetical protein